VQGLLLRPIQPVYPAIAKAARVQGEVVIDAIISKAGRIESLKVLSGPQMLRQAALDAVEQARYQPYRLNGEPVEVQTEVRVVFRLGS
jgi:protein TonB